MAQSGQGCTNIWERETKSQALCKEVKPLYEQEPKDNVMAENVSL